MSKPLSTDIIGYEEIISCRWFGEWHFHSEYWKKFHKIFNCNEIDALMFDHADEKLKRRYDKREKEMKLEYGN